MKMENKNQNQNAGTEAAFGLIQLIFLAISIGAGIVAMSGL